MKYLWGIGALILLLIWLFFPSIFNWWAVNVWNLPVAGLETLGPLGDIYGSLNTLFTSATLVIVIYSVLLQRRANNDSKIAIDEQLKQAREATQEQLNQSRTATNQQLDQAQKAFVKQIELAKLSYEAQIRESRYAVFASMFNALMALKQSKLEKLTISNKMEQLTGFEIFNSLAAKFSDSFSTNEFFYDEYGLNSRLIKSHFYRTLKKLNNNQKFYDLGSYFLIYENLLNLIKQSGLEDHEKEFFKVAIRNSMSGAEQLTLFWMGAYSNKYKEFLNESQLFSQFYSEKMMPFAVKFHDKSCFSHPEILKNWDKFINIETPA